MNAPGTPSRRAVLAVGGVAAALVVAVAAEVAWTAPTRGAVRTYNALLAAANHQPEPDLAAARRLCTARFLQEHGLKPARAGGFVGLPRGIHKNFQVWRHGGSVWLCPTNRAGPVYQFVPEGGRWKFDGLVGQLLPTGRVLPLDGEGETDAGLD